MPSVQRNRSRSYLGFWTVLRCRPCFAASKGILDTNPAPVVNVVAEARRQHRRRVAATMAGGAVVLVPALWFSLQVVSQQSIAFHEHVLDEQGNAVAGAIIEADGIRADTNMTGEFVLVLPGPPSRRALRVTARKVGYRRRAIDTQSDVPDLGVVLEKDR